MPKYLLPILIFLLSACTRQVVVPDAPQRELSEQEGQVLGMNTSMLLANMDINEESIFTGGAWVSGNPVYTGAYNLLNQVESRCIGTDFEEFRICLIDGLSDIRDAFDELTKQGGDIDTYIDSIRRELTYMADYSILDDQPMPSEYYKGGLWDETPVVNACYSVLTGSASYSGGSYYPNEKITIPIVLGFQDTAYQELVSMFPSWKTARTIPITREASHCSWMTFGPGYGTVLYAFEKDNTVYLFIKDADGAGSGDFSYSIFAYRNDSQKFVHLGSFYAYSGIIPLPLVRNDENGEPMGSSRSKILSNYRNRTFLYTSYIPESMRNITNTIQSLLEQSIQ